MKSDPDRERMYALLEVAKFWRARSRFLERRLEEFGDRLSADPQTLDGEVHRQVVRLRKLVGEEVEVGE